MAKKTKFYVVWRGHETGVFKTWVECKRQVDGFAGAQYRSFGSAHEAEEAYLAGYASFPAKNSQKQKRSSFAQGSKPYPLEAALCVDAACSGNPGKMEYRAVDLLGNQEIFRQAYPLGTNNIGEFLAIVHALALIEQKKIDYPKIYTDSKIAMSWVNKKKCRTRLTENNKTKTLFEHIRRAEKWLEKHSELCLIVKWDTEAWGEIPADFGRK